MNRYTMGAACYLFGLTTLILFSAFPSPVLTYLFPIFFGMGYASTAALPPLITADPFLKEEPMEEFLDGS